jgi:hypothetical protein
MSGGSGGGGAGYKTGGATEGYVGGAGSADNQGSHANGGQVTSGNATAPRAFVIGQGYGMGGGGAGGRPAAHRGAAGLGARTARGQTARLTIYAPVTLPC